MHRAALSLPSLCPPRAPRPTAPENSFPPPSSIPTAAFLSPPRPTPVTRRGALSAPPHRLCPTPPPIRRMTTTSRGRLLRRARARPLLPLPTRRAASAARTATGAAGRAAGSGALLLGALLKGVLVGF
ncbi:hypothetical protein BRADI_2g26367v3 [Brachypodium distachyon]|uniref:Uncharacterized protein n=1 Tax=Brachypodium distachyon TaxID=15368 RepID=A0A2K2DAN1_BRADI|nr:hypothetical protein BRADI_2g26367v3 [Brachypodium distachyon]